MNYLHNVSELKNRYFVIRHGNSLANQQALVVSSPQTGIDNYGLTSLGQTQVVNSLQLNTTLPDNFKIISSDFKRASETAKIVKQHCNSQNTVHYDVRLRERFFGDYDGGPNTAYEKIWALDEQNADQVVANVESANNVTRRASELIAELERTYNKKCFLLVSHGDTLQLLQTAFLKKSAQNHRSVKHLETAEIRELILTII